MNAKIRTGPFAIIGAAKYKTNVAIKGIATHDLRLGTNHGPGVDPSRSHLNVQEGATTYEQVTTFIKERLKTLTRKPRPDANKVIEILVTASKEGFEGKTYAEQLQMLKDGVEFAKNKAGADNVISVSYHFDERTPHAHILAIPIVTRPRSSEKDSELITTLDAQRILGGPKEMTEMWSAYADHMQEKGHNLKRGVSKKEREAALQQVPTHKTVRQFWAEKVEEIEGMYAAQIETLETASVEAKRAADARRSAENSGLDAQKMGGLMLQKAKQRAEEIEAAAHAKTIALEAEAARLREKEAQLEEWASSLKASSEQIAIHTAHITLIDVPRTPPATRREQPQPKPSPDASQTHPEGEFGI